MGIFIIIWSVWFASEIIINIFLRSGTSENRNDDKGSNKIIWTAVLIAIFLGVLFNMNTGSYIVNTPVFPYSGLALIISGMTVRIFSVISLGRLFTVDFTIRQNHKIKKDGIYSLIRHPSYLGSIISFIGLGISFNNWLSLSSVILFIVPAFIYRIKTEETMLIRKFGTVYSDYMKKTYRLLPWIY